VTFESPGYLWTYELRHGNGKDPWATWTTASSFMARRRASGSIAKATRCSRRTRARNPCGYATWDRTRNTSANWLDCIRSRQRPNADVELGHLGSVPAHLSNIAYRVGRRIRWDGVKETIPGDSEAVALLGRAYRKPYVLPKV